MNVIDKMRENNSFVCSCLTHGLLEVECMEKMKGRIVNIEKYQNRATYIKQGIKGSDQYKYNGYPGGNGTYVTGGEYLGTSLMVKIYVFDLDKSFTFDVYDDIKALSGKSRISSKMLETIESHIGEKIDVYVSGSTVNFDSRVLLL